MPVALTMILAGVVATSLVPMQDPSTLDGVVLERATGEPLPGASVFLSVYLGDGLPLPNSSPNEFVILEDETDSEGRFEIEVRGIEGRHPFSIRKAGYLGALPTADFSPGAQSRGHVFLLDREGVVHGRVLDEFGQPAVAAQVTLYQFRPGTFAHLTGRRPEFTDDRGQFRFFGLVPGQYIVGYAPREFAAGEALPIVLGEFSESRSVPTTIYPGAGRVEDAIVVDLSLGGEVALRDVILAARSVGRIRIELAGRDIPPDLRVSALGVDAPGSRFMTFWPRQVGTLNISATWTDADGTRASRAAPVFFDGRDVDVKIDLAPRGSLDIRAIREGANGTEEPVNGRVNLCPASFDPGMCVNTALLLGGTNRADRVVLDENGFARVRSVPTGEYHLFGVDVPDGYYLASALQGRRDVLVEGVDISESSHDLDLRFAPGPATLTGRVTNSDGEPVSQAFVVLIPDAPIRYSWVADHRVRSSVDGAFSLEGIAPGTYRIAAVPHPPGSVHVLSAGTIREIRNRGTPVELEAGERASVDLVLSDASPN